MDTLRVGIIGTGMIAVAGHLPAWKNLGDDVELVGVADILPDRAKLVAETEGIPHAYGDWERMLDELDLDVVSVCTPNSYHREQTIAALQAGAHVLCEKPVATCHADAAEMFDEAEAQGKHLMIGNLVALQFQGSRNWPFGSASAVILMTLVLIALMILIWLKNRNRVEGR